MDNRPLWYRNALKSTPKEARNMPYGALCRQDVTIKMCGIHEPSYLPKPLHQPLTGKPGPFSTPAEVASKPVQHSDISGTARSPGWGGKLNLRAGQRKCASGY